LQSVQIQSALQEEAIIKRLWTFCVNHKQTLKKVSVGFLSQCPFTDIECTPMEPAANVDKLKQQITGLKLKSFFVKNIRRTLRRSERSQQLLSLILGACELPSTGDGSGGSLQHVLCIGRQHPPLDQEIATGIATSNYRTLVSLELTISTEDDNISCGQFSQCEALKILTLMRELQEDGNNAQEEMQLTEINLLPPGLASLRVFDLKILTAEARFDNFQELRCLELQKIGTSGEFGLSAAALFSVLKAMRVDKIYFQQALNEESFAAEEEHLRFAYMSGDKDKKGVLLLLLARERPQYSQHVVSYRVEDLDEHPNYPMYSFHETRPNYFKNIAVPFPALAGRVGFHELTFNEEAALWDFTDAAAAEIYAAENEDMMEPGQDQLEEEEEDLNEPMDAAVPEPMDEGEVEGDDEEMHDENEEEDEEHVGDDDDDALEVEENAASDDDAPEFEENAASDDDAPEVEENTSDDDEESEDDG
jgi:hypothetical protein